MGILQLRYGFFFFELHSPILPKLFAVSGSKGISYLTLDAFSLGERVGEEASLGKPSDMFFSTSPTLAISNDSCAYLTLSW